jgi:ABC-type polysaccharide/polyol phosphate export permease
MISSDLEDVMSNRRRLARERLEVYLLHLLLAYRHLILIVGMLMLAYAIAILFTNPPAGTVILVPAIFLLLLSNSFNVALYTARLGAWIGTLWKDDD